MSIKTSIEWTQATWNPMRGCRRVSAGCENCYAERMAARFAGRDGAYEGLVELGKKGPRWTGRARFEHHKLWEPLSWREPRRVFVDSMSDLFYEGFHFEEIAAVFGVMAACQEHTFQVLTKRPSHALEFFRWLDAQDAGLDGTPGLLHSCVAALDVERKHHPEGDGGPLHRERCADPDGTWPLPNVWLGVSVENQSTADERIPLLLECPAAIRFVSYEPALGPVDFRPWLEACHPIDGYPDAPPTPGTPALDWIIVGGESGPGARPFDVAWARSTIEQCRSAEVACFVKQLGANVRTRNDDNFTIDEEPYDPDFPGWPFDLEARGRVEEHPNGHREAYQGAPVRIRLCDSKGGEPGEWRQDLRVREWPEVRR